MAYTHSKMEYLFQSTGTQGLINGQATTIQAYWAPGCVPHYVRRFAIAFTTSGMVGSTSLQVDLEIIDLTSGSTASDLLTIHGTASDVAGRVLYKDATSNLLVSPGQMLQVKVEEVSTASGVCNFLAMAYLEPSWEEPGNNTDMVATPTA